MNRSVLMLAALTTLGLAGGTVMADALSFNFNNYALGNLPGSSGADTRTPGNGNWWFPANAATTGQVVNVGAGNNALLITNNGNGNDGVVNNVVSPQLKTLAGQTGPDAQPGATASTFNSSFQFHTQDAAPVAGTPADAFQFKTENLRQRPHNLASIRKQCGWPARRRLFRRHRSYAYRRWRLIYRCFQQSPQLERHLYGRHHHQFWQRAGFRCGQHHHHRRYDQRHCLDAYRHYLGRLLSV